MSTNAPKSGDSVLTDEPVQQIPLAAIHVDYAWNARSFADVKSEASDAVQDTTGKHTAEGTGIKGLTLSIRSNGQDTPVIVRPVPADRKGLRGGKIPEPYKFELVCGFRRFTAVAELNTPEHLAHAAKAGTSTVPNVADGHIRAFVRNVDAADARMLNGRENTERSNLKTPDLMLLCRELQGAGKTQVQIAEGLGISQGYLSKLLAISKLPRVILDHWREGKALPGVPEGTPTIMLTTAQMLDLVKVAEGETGKAAPPEREIVERYVRQVAPSVANATADGPVTRGEADKAKAAVVEFATMIGALVRTGFVEPGNLNWNKVIGPKKLKFLVDSRTGDMGKILALIDAAEAAYEEEVNRKDEPPATGDAATAN